MNFKELTVKQSKNNFYIFIHKNISLECIEIDNVILYNLNEQIKNNEISLKKFLLNKLNYVRILDDNIEVSTKSEFLKLISWINPLDYKTYKKIIFCIELKIFLDKIKTSNDKLKKLCDVDVNNNE